MPLARPVPSRNSVTLPVRGVPSVDPVVGLVSEEHVSMPIDRGALRETEAFRETDELPVPRYQAERIVDIARNDFARRKLPVSRRLARCRGRQQQRCSERQARQRSPALPRECVLVSSYQYPSCLRRSELHPGADGEVAAHVVVEAQRRIEQARKSRVGRRTAERVRPAGCSRSGRRRRRSRRTRTPCRS